MAYNQRVQFVQQSFNMVWKDPKFTAKEIVDAMGTDAGLMFQEHGLEQQSLARIAGEAGLTYTPLVPLNKITPVLGTDGVTPTGAITVDMNLPYGAA
jgi:hypothetical protein